jgi:hypothetical protein
VVTDISLRKLGCDKCETARQLINVTLTEDSATSPMALKLKTLARMQSRLSFPFASQEKPIKTNSFNALLTHIQTAFSFLNRN